MDTNSNMKDKIDMSSLKVGIEPIHIKVGFKHIDFVNIIMVQVNGIVDYLGKINKGTENIEGIKSNRNSVSL